MSPSWSGSLLVEPRLLPCGHILEHPFPQHTYVDTFFATV